MIPYFINKKFLPCFILLELHVDTKRLIGTAVFTARVLTVEIAACITSLLSTRRHFAGKQTAECKGRNSLHFFFFGGEAFLESPCSYVCVSEDFRPDVFILTAWPFATTHCKMAPQWELRTQKLKSHLMRTPSLKVLFLQPGVGQYIAIHDTLTARDFFLANFYLPVHSLAFLPKPLPSFFCVSCG